MLLKAWLNDSDPLKNLSKLGSNNDCGDGNDNTVENDNNKVNDDTEIIFASTNITLLLSELSFG